MLHESGWTTPTAKIDVPKSEPAEYGGSWRLRGWQRMTIKVLQVQYELHVGSNWRSSRSSWASSNWRAVRRCGTNRSIP